MSAFALSNDAPNMMSDADKKPVPRAYGQSNELIRAAYSMPLYCKRMLLIGLSKITYSSEVKDDEAFTFIVTAKEWNRVFNSGSDAYAQMRKAAKELNDRETGALWFKTDTEHSGNRWFDNVAYPLTVDDKGQGYARMQFHRGVRNHLIKLTKHGCYTKVDLMAVCAMESTYSIRLFELCRQFRDKGILILPVVEFRRIFCMEHSYTAFTDLRVKVLDKSVREINDKTYFDGGLTYDMQKQGQRITTLVFKFPKEAR